MSVQLSPADRARLADRRRVAEMFRKRKLPTVGFDTDLVLILDDYLASVESIVVFLREQMKLAQEAAS